MPAGHDIRVGSNGFTLIELIVVVAMIAIMMGIAAPSFVRFQRGSELTGVANSLVGSIAAARAEAMKRNRNAYVMPITDNSWRDGWRVFVDQNNDGVFNDGTDLLVMTEPAMPRLVGTPGGTGVNEFANGSSKYIMFNGAGFPRQSDGSFILASTLELKFDEQLRRRVTLTPSGRFRVCDPVKETGGSC